MIRPGRFFALSMLAGALFALGCEITDTFSQEIDFGDQYTLDVEDTPPRLDAAGLHATVRYSGGCMAHQFQVFFRVRGETTELWLRHDGNRDLCQAFVSETRTLTVPRRVFETEFVTLLAPGGETVRLR